MADATGTGGCGVDSGEDDSWLRAESRRVNIVTNTYTN